MDSQKQQILERIKQANNILVTVSANPSVDQLASCLGLTIMLNELGKHATAVFSGGVPSTIEFLQPEKTLEKNTDSLRDFIIALDKAKADKLRYKVEDTVVKIFITPYRTSIDEKDLEFSQGDFNVEAVIALGVHDQKDLDQAITAHGRILHDATVMSVNTTAGNNLGTINWQDPKASSLSEMVSSLAENFDKKVLDNQVATALLTGIVAETERFSNAKTTPDTMKASALLMAAGANQQLVATKLQEPPPPIPVLDSTPDSGDGNAAQPSEPPKSNDGTLQIEHDAADMEAAQAKRDEANSSENSDEADNGGPQIHIDDTGQLHRLDTDQPVDHEPSPSPSPTPPPPHQLGEDRELLEGPGPTPGGLDAMSGLDEDEKPSGEPMVTEGAKFVFDPPTLGGTLTANSKPEDLEPTTDPLSAASSDQQPILSHDEPASSSSSAGPLVITPPSEDVKPDADTSATLPQLPTDDTPPDDTMAKLPSITLPEPQLDPAAPTSSAAPVITPFDIPTPSTPSPSPLVMPAADDADATTPAMLTPTVPVEPATPETVTTTTPAAGEDENEFTPDVSTARDAVMSAIDTDGPNDVANPIAALNAQPLGGPLHEPEAADDTTSTNMPPSPVIQPLGNPNFNEAAPDAASPSAQPLDMPLPPTLLPPPASTTPPTSSLTDNPSAPPPVPPPMMPPFGSPGGL